MFSILYAVQSAAATAELDGEKREEREGVFVRAGKSRNESKRSRNESESVASRALLRLLCRSRRPLRDPPRARLVVSCCADSWCLVSAPRRPCACRGTIRADGISASSCGK